MLKQGGAKMKITKEMLTQIIKEETNKVLNEVSVVKDGQFETTDNLKWEILDNGRICFETWDSAQGQAINICVPLEELKQILSPPKNQDINKNAAAWDFVKKSMPADPDIEKKLKNPFLESKK